MRGLRTIRLAKWAGVGLCVLVALVWAVSMWRTVGFDARARVVVAVKSGVFIAFWADTIEIRWAYYSSPLKNAP